MRPSLIASSLTGLALLALPGHAVPSYGTCHGQKSSPPRYGALAPKVMIVSMFDPEADVWYLNMPRTQFGTLMAQNVTVPALSPLFPAVHCTKGGEVCQVTLGESEINAAASMSALVLSDRFDLRRTYFMTAGIAGVNPKLGTLGTVALAKFSVQVALQYEFDAREMPANFSTGYLPYGAYMPDQYPTIVYGTEVMEVNEALRDAALALAARANLTDTQGNADYRARYQSVAGQGFAAAVRAPSVIKGDTATSDVYYSGALLSAAFENTTRVWTNQTTVTYAMTAQEDSAVLQVLMRADLAGAADFSRVIVMRTGSDFDRPPPGVTVYEHLRVLDQNGFETAVANIFLAGFEIVRGIVADWAKTYAQGIKPTNYIGDVLGSLGGTPNFGHGSVYGANPPKRVAAQDGGCADSSRPTSNYRQRRSRRLGRRAGGWK